MEQVEDIMVVTFEPTGAVHAMHRDQFGLGFLGKQQIERASEILFNEGTQKWAVHLPIRLHGEIIKWHAVPEAEGFDGYNEARGFEVQWLERCALAGIEPLSEGGIMVAKSLRERA